jgi:hypothetical protein
MEPGYFIIAILGCADGSVQCTNVATVPTHYARESACSAAAPDALLNNSDFDFPSLVAECRPIAAPAAASQERPEPTPADTMRS